VKERARQVAAIVSLGVGIAWLAKKLFRRLPQVRRRPPALPA
jgi:hypothetical protein